MPHRAQLHICHEVLPLRRKSGGVAGLPAAHPPITPETQYCSLKKSLLWCADCDYLVCSQHAYARHKGHDVRPE